MLFSIQTESLARVSWAGSPLHYLSIRKLLPLQIRGLERDYVVCHPTVVSPPRLFERDLKKIIVTGSCNSVQVPWTLITLTFPVLRFCGKQNKAYRPSLNLLMLKNLGIRGNWRSCVVGTSHQVDWIIHYDRLVIEECIHRVVSANSCRAGGRGKTPLPSPRQTRLQRCQKPGQSSRLTNTFPQTVINVGKIPMESWLKGYYLDKSRPGRIPFLLTLPSFPQRDFRYQCFG